MSFFLYRDTCRKFLIFPLDTFKWLSTVFSFRLILIIAYIISDPEIWNAIIQFIAIYMIHIDVISDDDIMEFFPDQSVF